MTIPGLLNPNFSQTISESLALDVPRSKVWPVVTDFHEWGEFSDTFEVEVLNRKKDSPAYPVEVGDELYIDTNGLPFDTIEEIEYIEYGEGDWKICWILRDLVVGHDWTFRVPDFLLYTDRCIVMKDITEYPPEEESGTGKSKSKDSADDDDAHHVDEVAGVAAEDDDTLDDDNSRALVRKLKSSDYKVEERTEIQSYISFGGLMWPFVVFFTGGVIADRFDTFNRDLRRYF